MFGGTKVVRVVVAGASAALALGMAAAAQAEPSAGAPGGAAAQYSTVRSAAAGWEFLDDYWTLDDCRAEGYRGLDRHEWTAFQCRPGPAERNLWVQRT